MSYDRIEEALVSQLAMTTGFSTNRVARGDMKLLNTGRSPVVVVKYGGFQSEVSAQCGQKDYTWFIDLFLCIKYQNDAQVHLDARTYREYILRRLESYPKLGNLTGVLDSNSTRGEPSALGDPFEIARQVGGVKYYIELIRHEVQEQVDFDLLG